jgi:hypothetical protein
MELEVGKYYKDADGNKVGPLRHGEQWPEGPWLFKCDNKHFRKNGESCFDARGYNVNSGHHLIAEWTDEPELQLEKGKFYRTRDGRKVGPMVYDGSLDYFNFDDGSKTGWQIDGRIAWSKNDGDIISEWTDEEQKSYMYHNPDDAPSLPEYAQLASEHAIKITVTIGEIVIEYDGSGG